MPGDMDDKAFDELFGKAFEEYSKFDSDQIGFLKDSKFAKAILDNFEKNFDGDLASFKKKVGIKESDPPFQQVYKIYQYEKSQNESR